MCRPSTWRRGGGADRAPTVTCAAEGKTTLSVMVTNQRLSARALRQVHGSMSRAIEPFHSPVDGDVLYAVTTNKVAGGDVNEFVLAAAASELAWDAVLGCWGDGCK